MLGLSTRERKERLERDIERIKARGELYEVGTRTLQEIKVSRPSYGRGSYERFSGLSGSSGGRPAEFYRAFVYDMDRAQGEEEEKKVLTDYVRKMVYGGMGYTTAAAVKKLQEKWRQYQENLGGI